MSLELTGNSSSFYISCLSVSLHRLEVLANLWYNMGDIAFVLMNMTNQVPNLLVLCLTRMLLVIENYQIEWRFGHLTYQVSKLDHRDFVPTNTVTPN